MAVSAARGIVAAEGLRGLTARRVAAEIGYSPGTLYNIFRDLDDLVVRVNAGTLDALRDALAAVAPQPDAEAAVLALAAAYVRFTQENAGLWQVLFEHRLPPGRELPPWYPQKLGRVLGLVEAACGPLLAGRAPAERAEAVRLLWTALHGLTSLAQGGKLEFVTDRPLDAAAAAMVRIVLAGLRAAPTKV